MYGLSELQDIVRVAYERAAQDTKVDSNQAMVVQVIDSLLGYIVHEGRRQYNNYCYSGEGEEQGYSASKEALFSLAIKLCDRESELLKYEKHECEWQDGMCTVCGLHDN